MAKALVLVGGALGALVLAAAVAAMLGARPSTGPCIGAQPPEREIGASRFSSYRVQAADGNCLQGYEWRPSARPVTGTLLIIHGVHDHARRYEGLALALNEIGVAVVAQDHRGHAGSGGARQRVDSVPQLVDDVSLALQRAAQRDPGVPLFVHGHSMGGLIAAHLTAGAAASKGPALAGVVLSSAALKLPPAAAGAARHVVGAIAKLAPERGLEAVDPATLMRDPAALAALAADPLISRDKVPAATIATILGGIVALPTAADPFGATPLLILHGSADRVTEPDGSRELAARVKGSTLKLYDGRLHDLLHDAGGEDIVREVTGFVGARVGRGVKP